MQFKTPAPPHTRLDNDVTRVMAEVLIALVPGIAAMTWYFGWGVPITLLLAITTAVATEALALWLRGRPPKATLMDLSALVTATLFTLTVPPTLPWWLSVLGMVFAIGVVKQLFGGLGYNPFNPAMAAYVFLLISYPVSLTAWPPIQELAPHPLHLMDYLGVIFGGHPPGGLTWDAVTMATPLGEMRTQLGMDHMISEIRQSPLWGDYGGRGWEWIANWYLLGGLWLLFRKAISWRIPASMLGGLLVMAGLFWMMDPESHPFPAFHLFSGGAMLGAFFIATDPVTAATTPKGQLIYGLLIGVLVFVIRTWGGYPDAVAFSVLLMNMAAPTIDQYTRPRVFGTHAREAGHED